MQLFDYSVNTYDRSQVIEVVPKCNSITIINSGSSNALVDGIPVYPGTEGTNQGDSVTIGGNAGEMLAKKRLQISFTPGAVNPEVTIVQKFYV